MRNLLGSFSLDFMYMSASAPDAPPLSETTIGCFIRLFFCTAACSMRAIWSEAPPAPAATTISTGLVGCQASAGAAASASMPAHRWKVFRSFDMALPLLGSRARGEPPELFWFGAHFACLDRHFKQDRARPARDILV